MSNPRASRWFAADGSPLPLGQSWIASEKAWNFSLFSKHATAVTLLLFGDEDLVHPLYRLQLEPLKNKWQRVWCCRIKKDLVPRARYYAYSIDGPKPEGPRNWHAFDSEKLLLDPYAREIHFPPSFERGAARRPGSNAGKAPLAVLMEPETPFDWGSDQSPRHESGLVIYELHVRGFTRSPTSGLDLAKRGTFAGLVEKIPHLKKLGVTAVELMPVHQFDPQEGSYWGYMSLNYFTPHHAYASQPARARNEFKELVKALHTAGIEVILDVVYNHTTEADQHGPTYSFKGIDCSTYYLLSEDREAPFQDHSGCGNTVRCANRFVRTLIVDSLRYWVTEYHVDGFRFDLASVFERKLDGTLDLEDPPIITAIRADPVLRHVRLIAEPWDASGIYRLGQSFPGQSWHQWNGKYRDAVRRFVKSDKGMIPTIMQRLYGSDDLFPDSLMDACRPLQSINYINSHDGFTLYDLVSYNEKLNWANGHGNTDGASDNHSWNCGHEGEHGVTPEVLNLRKRQVKNFCTLLLLSNGIPMICAGDEFLHTQGGNNNPYNQDNETAWLNWGRVEQYPDVLRFFQRMIAFRKAHPSLCRSRFWREDVTWHGTGAAPDKTVESHSVAFHLAGASEQDRDIYVMVNAYWEKLTFEIQKWNPNAWKRVIDTMRLSPEDIMDAGAEPHVHDRHVEVGPRSIVVLIRAD